MKMIVKHRIQIKWIYNPLETQNNKVYLYDYIFKVISSKSLTIGDDFEALDLCNIQFLKMSQNVFNQPKKPIFIS